MTSLNTLLLPSDKAGIAQAAALLADGGLVALPTETVYGLGADARAGKAVAGIYAAKGRPGFNPLIVHVPNSAAAQTYVKWNDAAERLASAFWPGPLTLVLPLCEGHGIASLVTAGLDSLAVRCPAHPVAQALLTAFNGPIAAPSANPSGKISPTTAAHVLEGLSGKIDAVLDGGSTEIGLESTIVGLTGLGQTGAPTLLRHGSITREMLEAALGAELHEATTPAAITAPGQLASHYAPDAALRLNVTATEQGEALLGFGPVENATLNLSPAGDLREAAANLFAMLRELDATEVKIAVSPIPAHGIGLAINDRLIRAAAPR
ncbi:L-threonylcarbamoyladenylate synthase [Lentibacter sp. XHP0401]|uniref:L-threonylcarbamoyladenylate synthase n=1 Tax=Lentibacter sp. XHP0401 TaxID=2984334 RepID=UPI0021E70A03|nr:L-threonylcarbamoyladenylate synthase [Lentibacter sp. XHP0401]MCV2892923.1 L-threonylcarbamoyladenylate synthase [Lentibacter sp. XHP0401]